MCNEIINLVNPNFSLKLKKKQNEKQYFEIVDKSV